MDEQEKMELRPKYSKCLIFQSTHFKTFLFLLTLPWSTRSVPFSDIKHRSTEHNSSLMMSESELDSDQDTIFSRDRPVRSRNRTNAQAARNGNTYGWAGTHRTGVVIVQHEWNPLLGLWPGCTARVPLCLLVFGLVFYSNTGFDQMCTFYDIHWTTQHQGDVKIQGL